MKKDFDSWNTEKKKTNIKRLDFNFFYHNREVWWCAVGINVGVETVERIKILKDLFLW